MFDYIYHARNNVSRTFVTSREIL